MSTDGSRGVDRQAAEQLLSGAGDGALADALRAAAAPAHAEELAGEEAAVAAFREAGALDAVAGTAPRRSSGFRTAFGRLLTVKAAVAAAVVGSTGIVLAATGGVLPAPWSTVPPVEQPETTTSVPGPVVPPADRSADPGSPSSPPTISAPSATGTEPPASGPAAPGENGRPTKAPKTTKTTKPPKTTKTTKTTKTDEPLVTPTVGKPEKSGRIDVSETRQPKKPDKGGATPPAARTPPSPPAPGSHTRGAANARTPSGGAGPPSQGG